MRWIPLTLLAGCPYIWDAPVDPVLPDGDADTDVDADTDADTDTDTHDTGRSPLEVDTIAYRLDRFLARLLVSEPPERITVEGLPDGVPLTLERDGLLRLGPGLLGVPLEPVVCGPFVSPLTFTAEGPGGVVATTYTPRLTYIDHDAAASTPTGVPPLSACGNATTASADCLEFAGSGPHLVEVLSAPAARITLQRGSTQLVGATGSLRRTIELDAAERYQLCVQGDEVPWSALVTR